MNSCIPHLAVCSLLKHPIITLLHPTGLIGLLSNGCAPTKAYWLDSIIYANRQEGGAWLQLNPLKPPGSTELLALDGVVVIRTLPWAWLAALRQFRRDGKPVVLVLDDALLEPAAMAELGWCYRWRLWWGLGRHRRRLARMISEIWVSTDALAESCRSHLAPQKIAIRQIPLQPPRQLIQTPLAHRVAYQGTASHRAELAWLLPVLTELQLIRQDILLELILNRQWRNRFRSLPRTVISYPMDWETYLLDTGNRRLELLLVPLLPGAFNAGRAAVKFIDAARLGAVGLFSDRPPYRGFVRHGEDGLLLPDNPKAWLGAIDALLGDDSRRQAMADQCQARALEICSKGGVKIDLA